ncbi:MAG: hypothetical protein KDG89_03620 [Geminicoccaceae bacterium]|nr:hypothetical protein [Geminicoccaceae bacterium]
MPDTFTLALVQAASVPGGVAGNARRIGDAYRAARRAGAGLVVCPRLALTGAPLGVLTPWPPLAAEAGRALDGLAGATAEGPPLVVGAPYLEDGRPFDGAFLLRGGAVADRCARHVPEAGDPLATGPLRGPWRIDGLGVGAMVGADMNTADAAEALAETGADLLVVLDALALAGEDEETRMQAALARVAETGLPLAWVNGAGAGDGRVLAGGSFALDAKRRLVARAPDMEEALLLVPWRLREAGLEADGGGGIARPLDPQDVTWRALVVGLRAFVDGGAYEGVAVDLDAGINGAVAAALAVDALGPKRVLALATAGDAGAHPETAAALGLRVVPAPVAPLLAPYRRLVGADDSSPLARLRGLALEGIAAARGLLPLATCDKTMLALGGEALAGHSAGGYAPLADLWASKIVGLVQHRNGSGPILPERPLALGNVAGKARDRLLARLVEDDADPATLGGEGVALAARVAAAGRERRRAPPGTKVTKRAFFER